VVESALADAIGMAAAASAWDVVTKLAGELEARRKARQSSSIVDLAAERAKRDGKK
jgi:hypothetical protein